MTTFLAAFALFANSLSLGLPFSLPQTAPAARTFRLAAVEVAGAKRYTSTDLAKLGGLAIGQSIAVPDLASAASRLGDSGFFKSLNYRYVTTGDRITVTFEFEEADWTVPVVLDNFVWFSDKELIASIRQDVPSFDGTAPPTEGIIPLITRSLASIMKTRQLPGQVHYSPEGDTKGNLLRHVFSLKDPGPKVCAVRFEGVSAIAEPRLLEPVKAIVGGDYSRAYLTAVARGTLTHMYRQQGHWRAGFGEPVVRVEETPACSGVVVTLPVSEGVAYSFERAEWRGNSAIPAAMLDTLFGMKQGEVANVAKLDDGLRQLKRAYGKQGYVTESAKYTAQPDDASRRAVFEVAIEEGPQFRMGTIEFLGVADRDAASLLKKWKLKPGDVFDMSYVDQFQADEIAPVQRASGKRANMEGRLDAEQRVVNVTFVFK